VTPLGVVFLFMLVNWWVEKHQRFLFNVYKRFLFLSRFYVFNVFLLFFLERFFYICQNARTSHASSFSVCFIIIIIITSLLKPHVRRTCLHDNITNQTHR